MIREKKVSFTTAFSQDKTDYWPKNVQTELNSVSLYQLLFKVTGYENQYSSRNSVNLTQSN